MKDQASNTTARITGAEAGPAGNRASEGGAIVFEDAMLVQRTRQGDMQAFGLLVAKYQHRIFNTILKICIRPAEAEELTQETFLKALERIGQFLGKSRFYTWLFRIGVNLAISHRRRLGCVKFQSLSEPEEFRGSQADRLTAAVAAQRQADPQVAAMSAETARRINEALAELDDDFRLVVILRDVEGMNYAEIAEVTDLPVGTVKSRLHRARCALREKLTDLIDQA